MGQLILLAVALAMLVGLVGRDRMLGFWGYFFASLLLTPIIGILLVVVSAPRKRLN